MDPPAAYDPRYLAGVEFFNRGEFFDAHEAWEELWLDCDAGPRRFVQGLIQAAVALYHAGRGNWRGARRLFHSARAYMAAYPSPYLGLDVERFWSDMEVCLAACLRDPPPEENELLDRGSLPRIELAPPAES